LVIKHYFYVLKNLNIDGMIVWYFLFH